MEEDSEKVPAPHLIQADAPAPVSVFVSDPGEQRPQLDACVLLYCPAWHAAHGSVDTAEYCPASHDVHLVPEDETTEVLEPAVTTDPAVQSSHATACAPLYLPAGQAAHATVDDAEYCP